MNLLNTNEMNQISGGRVGDIQEFIPESIPGLDLIGWQQKLVGYDTTTWQKNGWFWTSYHEEKTPIYEFTPVYA